MLVVTILCVKQDIATHESRRKVMSYKGLNNFSY